MATFPSIAPVHSAPKRTSEPEGVFSLGDGYGRSARFGLNSVQPEWQLTWEVSALNANRIDVFLQEQSNTGASFDWQPPDRATVVRWRCDEWTVEQTEHNWFRISATFRQVFELATAPLVIPEAVYCLDDVLCETDLGGGGGSGSTFNPLVYTYVRWKGVWKYALAGSDPYYKIANAASDWINLTSITHLAHRVDIPSIYTFLEPKGLINPWIASVEVRFTSTSNYADFYMLKIVDQSGNIVYNNFPYCQGYFGYGFVGATDLLFSAKGVWEFSNDASTVAITWAGPPS
jgi:phage-related protein